MSTNEKHEFVTKDGWASCSNCRLSVKLEDLEARREESCTEHEFENAFDDDDFQKHLQCAKCWLTIRVEDRDYRQKEPCPGEPVYGVTTP